MFSSHAPSDIMRGMALNFPVFLIAGAAPFDRVWFKSKLDSNEHLFVFTSRKAAVQFIATRDMRGVNGLNVVAAGRGELVNVLDQMKRNEIKTVVIDFGATTEHRAQSNSFCRN